MNVKIKPISKDATSMLTTLKADPLYLKHVYDEQNDYFVVTMKS